MRKIFLLIPVIILIAVWIAGEYVKSEEIKEIEKLWFNDQEEVFLLLSGGDIPNCTPIKYYKCGEYPFPNNFLIVPKDCVIENSKASVVCKDTCVLKQSDTCTSDLKNTFLSKEIKEYSEVYWANKRKLEKELSIITLIEVLSNGMSDERSEILKNYIIKLVVSNYPYVWKNFDYTTVQRKELFFSDPTRQRAERFFSYWKEYLSSCDELKQACTFTELKLLGQSIPYNESKILENAVKFAKKHNVTTYVEIHDMDYISEIKYNIKFSEQGGIGKKYYEKIGDGIKILQKPYKIYISPEGNAYISPI